MHVTLQVTGARWSEKRLNDLDEMEEERLISYKIEYYELCVKCEFCELMESTLGWVSGASLSAF